MNNVDEKDQTCCTEESCNGVESCDCQGICTCNFDEIKFEDLADDCDDCCCGDDNNDDDDCDTEDMDAKKD